MRTFSPRPGKCPHCKRFVSGLWVNRAVVLDFGVPGVAPREPNMSEPERCDDCDLLARLADPWYRNLCGMEAVRMENEALANGGKKPNG